MQDVTRLLITFIIVPAWVCSFLSSLLAFLPAREKKERIEFAALLSISLLSLLGLTHLAKVPLKSFLMELASPLQLDLQHYAWQAANGSPPRWGVCPKAGEERLIPSKAIAEGPVRMQVLQHQEPVLLPHGQWHTSNILYKLIQQHMLICNTVQLKSKVHSLNLRWQNSTINIIKATQLQTQFISPRFVSSWSDTESILHLI